MTTQPSIEFIYDFGSPNAYLVHLVVPELEARLNTRVFYNPVLLGGVFKATGNVSPAISLAGIKNKGEYGQLETARFVNKHGLADQYQWNSNFPVNTLLMMRIATLAKNDPDIYPKVVNAFFDAMWRHPKNMEDPALVAETLEAAGLSSSLIEEAADPANKQALMQATEDAVERGVFGAPSFFVGDELYFGKDKLREVEEAFLEQAGS